MQSFGMLGKNKSLANLFGIKFDKKGVLSENCRGVAVVPFLKVSLAALVHLWKIIHKKTMKNFFHDRIGELHNVTWPTRKQAIHAMILVLVIMLLVGAFLVVVDYFLSELVDLSFDFFKSEK